MEAAKAVMMAAAEISERSGRHTTSDESNNKRALIKTISFKLRGKDKFTELKQFEMRS